MWHIMKATFASLSIEEGLLTFTYCCFLKYTHIVFFFYFATQLYFMAIQIMSAVLLGLAWELLTITVGSITTK